MKSYSMMRYPPEIRYDVRWTYTGILIALAQLNNLHCSRAGYITFIGCVNDTPAIDGGEKHFQSDQYAYKWTDKNGEHVVRSAMDVLSSCGFDPTSSIDFLYSNIRK